MKIKAEKMKWKKKAERKSVTQKVLFEDINKFSKLLARLIRVKEGRYVADTKLREGTTLKIPQT